MTWQWGHLSGWDPHAILSPLSSPSQSSCPSCRDGRRRLLAPAPRRAAPRANDSDDDRPCSWPCPSLFFLLPFSSPLSSVQCGGQRGLRSLCSRAGADDLLANDNSLFTMHRLCSVDLCNTEGHGGDRHASVRQRRGWRRRHPRALVDEIHARGELPRLVSLLCAPGDDLRARFRYYGRKEVVDALVSKGLVKRLQRRHVDFAGLHLPRRGRPITSATASRGGEGRMGGGRREGRRMHVGPTVDMWAPLPHHPKPPSKLQRDQK